MHPNSVTPIVHEGKKFMPYPIRKPRDGAKIKILTTANEVKLGMQVQEGKGRQFVIDNEPTVLLPAEIQGWWYLESKPQVAHVHVK